MSDLDKFESKVKASLEADVQNLDAETRQQLATARRKALNQPQKTTWLNAWFKKDYWLPAGSLPFDGCAQGAWPRGHKRAPLALVLEFRFNHGER